MIRHLLATDLGSCILASNTLEGKIKVILSAAHNNTYIWTELEITSSSHNILVHRVVEVSINNFL